MSDKELIELINRLKEDCNKQKCCNVCRFFLKEYRCQIAWLTGLLASVPNKWDTEKIGKVICK